MLLPPLALLLLLSAARAAAAAAALQLRHSWKAADGGILAAAPVAVAKLRQRREEEEQEQRALSGFLATAGHDGGRVRLWRPPFPGDDGGDGISTTPTTSTATAVADVHGGSIFALDSSGDGYLMSGSFDRSASLHRIVMNPESSGSSGGSTSGVGGVDAAGEIEAHPVGTLPEHTGWVRGVKIVNRWRSGGSEGRAQREPQRPCQQQQRYLLSIGCNLVNVWTAAAAAAAASNSRATNQDDFQHRAEAASVERIARLDSGPSPGDPADEPFRRHDVLCIEHVAATAGSSDEQRRGGGGGGGWIVTGLVDGTLRAFDADWDRWADRRRRSGSSGGSAAYDCTGSCARVPGSDDADDDWPCAAARTARRGGGRVVGVHALRPGSGEFVSIGHDGRWVRWRVVDKDDDGTAAGTAAGGGKDEGRNGVGGPTSELFELERGEVPVDDSNSDGRIGSSVVVPRAGTEGSEDCRAYDLFVGTNFGRLYQISLSGDYSEQGKRQCKEIWREGGAGGRECAIMALTWVRVADDEEEEDYVVAGTSNGTVRVFA